MTPTIEDENLLKHRMLLQYVACRKSQETSECVIVVESAFLRSHTHRKQDGPHGSRYYVAQQTRLWGRTVVYDTVHQWGDLAARSSLTPSTFFFQNMFHSIPVTNISIYTCVRCLLPSNGAAGAHYDELPCIPGNTCEVQSSLHSGGEPTATCSQGKFQRQHIDPPVGVTLISSLHGPAVST